MTSTLAEFEQAGLSTLAPQPFLTPDAEAMKPSIFPPSTSALRVRLTMRSAAVDIGRVVIGRLAPARRNGYTHGRDAVLHGDAVGARIGAEVLSNDRFSCSITMTCLILWIPDATR